jgi:serine/threonine protein kinase
MCPDNTRLLPCLLPSCSCCLQREIRVLKRLNHPCVIRLFEVLEAGSQLLLVMEYASGGSLLDYVRGRKRLGEAEAAYFLQQILTGLQYCHDSEVRLVNGWLCELRMGSSSICPTMPGVALGSHTLLSPHPRSCVPTHLLPQVVHRDIKLENILLDGSRSMKLIDFGLAAFYAPGKKLRVHCGSPSYAAPEIVARKMYEGPPVDVWSLGVVLFAMLAGFLPFHSPTGNKQVRACVGVLRLPAARTQDVCGCTVAPALYALPHVVAPHPSCLFSCMPPPPHTQTQELCQKIMAGTFNTPDWLSPGARDLLGRMLTVDPEARITLADAAQHPWTRSSGLVWELPATHCYSLPSSRHASGASASASTRSSASSSGEAEGAAVATTAHAVQASSSSSGGAGVDGSIEAQASILEELEGHGYSRPAVLRYLAAAECNYITASYYLLAEARQEAAQKALPAKPWPFQPVAVSSRSSGSSSRSRAASSGAAAPTGSGRPPSGVGAAAAGAARPVSGVAAAAGAGYGTSRPATAVAVTS